MTTVLNTERQQQTDEMRQLNYAAAKEFMQEVSKFKRNVEFRESVAEWDASCQVRIGMRFVVNFFTVGFEDGNGRLVAQVKRGQKNRYGWREVYAVNPETSMNWLVKFFRDNK